MNGELSKRKNPADDGAAGASSSSEPAQMWAEGTTGSMEVVADVSGRELNGDCSGTNTDAPTVLLEVGMGGNPDTFNGVQDHLTPLTTFCLYDRAGTAFSDQVSVPTAPSCWSGPSPPWSRSAAPGMA